MTHSEISYSYRVVLEQPGDKPLLLLPSNNREEAEERLKAILNDLTAIYPNGWIERRPDRPDGWERVPDEAAPQLKERT